MRRTYDRARMAPEGSFMPVAWSFIRVISLVLGVSTTQASKEARMNNVARNYN